MGWKRRQTPPKKNKKENDRKKILRKFISREKINNSKLKQMGNDKRNKKNPMKFKNKNRLITVHPPTWGLEEFKMMLLLWILLKFLFFCFFSFILQTQNFLLYCKFYRFTQYTLTDSVVFVVMIILSQDMRAHLFDFQHVFWKPDNKEKHSILCKNPINLRMETEIQIQFVVFSRCFCISH